MYQNSRVGEYLRYSSERYGRYRGLSIFIFILDTISRKQYLSQGYREYLQILGQAKDKILLHCSMVHLCLHGFWCFGSKWLNMQIILIKNLNLTLERTILSQKSDIRHNERWLKEQITIFQYLICILICIFVILVNMSILSYLQDTYKGVYLLSRI